MSNPHSRQRPFTGTRKGRGAGVAHGAKRRFSPPSSISEVTLMEALAMRQAGYTWHVIATRLGLSVDGLRNALAALAVSKRFAATEIADIADGEASRSAVRVPVPVPETAAQSTFRDQCRAYRAKGAGVTTIARWLDASPDAVCDALGLDRAWGRR